MSSGEHHGLFGDKPIHTNSLGADTRAAQQGTKLVVASSSVIVDASGELSLRCANCQRIMPLRAFGVRNMGSGELRNQPQCRACR